MKYTYGLNEKSEGLQIKTLHLVLIGKNIMNTNPNIEGGPKRSRMAQNFVINKKSTNVVQSL